ncbi:MAG: hypothetical protein ACP5RC_02475, partial [Halothiobacillaceae bacterium]
LPRREGGVIIVPCGGQAFPLQAGQQAVEKLFQRPVEEILKNPSMDFFSSSHRGAPISSVWLLA